MKTGSAEVPASALCECVCVFSGVGERAGESEKEREREKVREKKRESKKSQFFCRVFGCRWRCSTHTLCYLKLILPEVVNPEQD